MGGLIGFELTRRLIRDSQPGPSHLFVSAPRAPHLRDDNPFLHTEPERNFGPSRKAGIDVDTSEASKMPGAGARG
jgi:surfactin synthase thioesterase subunit